MDGCLAKVLSFVSFSFCLRTVLSKMCNKDLKPNVCVAFSVFYSINYIISNDFKY